VLNKEGKYSEADEVLRGLLPDLQERFAGDDPRILGVLETFDGGCGWAREN
jgi:hypothetical protein